MGLHVPSNHLSFRRAASARYKPLLFVKNLKQCQIRTIQVDNVTVSGSPYVCLVPLSMTQAMDPSQTSLPNTLTCDLYALGQWLGAFNIIIPAGGIASPVVFAV